MSCCGKKRASVVTQANLIRKSAGVNPVVAPAQIPPAFGGSILEYVGASGLTVRGPVSGHVYRFSKSGTRISVDARDTPYLLAIPQLRNKL